MSVGTLTVTGDIGPDIALTAKVYTNVTTFSIDITKQLLTFTQSTAPTAVTTVDISAATTFTVTLSAAAGNYVITIS